MSQFIFIDGYKSLENFEIELKPGLNALIGANGAGKSNILGALNFVSSLFDSNLNEIVNSRGFKNISDLFNLNRESNKIRVILKGSHRNECRNLEYPQLGLTDNVDKIVSLYTNYNYEFVIGFDRNNQEPLTFLKQCLVLDFDIGGAEYTQPNKLVLEYSNDISYVKKNHLDEVGKYVSKNVSKISDFFETNFGLFKTESILSSVGHILYPVKNLIQDISFADVYEINPQLVRMDSFNTQRPKLLCDGSGFASTLFILKENNQHFYQRVIEGMKLISSDIVDIDVDYNQELKKYEIETTIRSDYESNETQVIPLELISDGALKWYVLVTVMVISTRPIVIDEPENFLNPGLHSIFVTYLREQLDFKEIFGLMTSHSQSLVDSIEPEELIFVRFKDGHTSASRVIDIENLKDHMEKNESGLGWYFVSDNLDYFCFEEIP